MKKTNKKVILSAVALTLTVPAIVAPAFNPFSVEAAVDVPKDLDSGTASHFFTKPDGSLWGWGKNSDGELGLGDKLPRTEPVLIPGIANVKEIDVENSMVMAVTEDGSVFLWGDGYSLGVGTGADVLTPTKVTGLPKAKKIIKTSLSQMVLTEAGDVYMWGSNTDGYLGLGDTVDRTVPTKIPTLSNIIDISTNRFSYFALKSDGTVYSWGSNSDGALGIGTTVKQLSPVKMNITGVKALYGGNFLIKNDGTVWSWGFNSWGLLGLGHTNNNVYVPTKIPGLTDVVTMSVNNYAVLAVKGDGTVLGWGAGTNNKTLQGGVNVSTPKVLAGLSNIKLVDMGQNNATAVTNNGEVLIWGKDYEQITTMYGQNGNGHFTTGEGTKEDPYLVSTLDDLKAINDGLSYHYKLTGDIDATGVTTSMGILTGGLDGDNHSISNYVIKGGGLFSSLDGAEVTNLKLADIKVTSNSNQAGALARKATDSTIDNVHVINPAIKSAYYAGGLFAEISNTSIDNSSVEGDSSESYIESISYVGGLVGQMDTSKPSTISNSHATIEIRGVKSLGGLVGISSPTSTIEKSYYDGDIKVKTTLEYTESESIVGGLVGLGNGSISESYSKGTITEIGGSDDTDRVGGLVGYFRGNINNSYSHMNIIVKGDEVGGLVGLQEGSILNSYAKGIVGFRSKGGGLVGSKVSGATTLSYWDTEASGVEVSAAGSGKTVEQMLTPTTYMTWDTAIWDMKQGSYPTLKAVSDEVPTNPTEPADGTYTLWSGDNPDGAFVTTLIPRMTVMGGKATSGLILDNVDLKITEPINTDLGEVVLTSDGNGNTLVSFPNGLGDTTTDETLSVTYNGKEILKVVVKPKPVFNFSF